MAEHRVPMLGAALSRASLRRRPDPEHSTDPQVRELVTALATLEVAPAPRADFRAELRAQLVAVAPRLVAEGEPNPPAAREQRDRAERAAHKAAAKSSERSGFRFAKPLIAAACVLTAFVVLLGGAVWISQRALPGDALYGLKRASEDANYAVTSGTVDRATLKLEFASRRISEVGELLPRASALAAGAGSVAGSGAINANTTKLVIEALASANGDVRSASSMLTTAAVRGKSTTPLDVMTNWAPGELVTMKQLVSSVRDSALRQHAVTTWTVINDASVRAAKLRSQVVAGCVNLAETDTLGPKPAAGTCSVTNRPGHSTGPGTIPTRRSTTPALATTAPAGRTTSGAGGTSSPARGGTKPGGTAPTSPGGSSSPPIVLPTTPTLPPGLPQPSGLRSLLPSSAHLPISVNSCGVHASVGNVGIGIGGC